MRRGGECFEAQGTALSGTGDESVWLVKNRVGTVRGYSVRLRAHLGEPEVGAAF